MKNTIASYIKLDILMLPILTLRSFYLGDLEQVRTWHGVLGGKDEDSVYG